MTEPFLLLFLGLVAALWYTGLRDREQALRAARAACARHEVQLLDETVALAKLRTARDGNGQLRLRRHYGFEFTADGMARRNGTVVLLGGRVVALTLDLEGHVLHDLAS